MDRLSELRGKCTQDNISIEMEPHTQAGAMNDFFGHVKAIQEGIKYVEHCTDDIKAKHSEVLLSTDQEHTKALNAELDNLIQQVVSKSAEVKAGLKMIEEQIKLIEVSSKPAEVRIRQNQHQLLLQHFLNAMKAYQAASEQYSQKYRDQVKRRIKTRYSAASGETLSEAEVEKLATSLLEEGKEDSIFQQCRDTYEQIRENHQDILRIERSMRELNQLFADMAILVEEQGELMDDIAHNVSKSVAYVQKGTAELRQSKFYVKKSRKKMCFVLCLLIILAAIIIVPMLATGFLF